MKVPAMIENKVVNSLHGSILNLLDSEYQFIVGEKIQNMFASDIVELVQRCYKESWKLDVGQVLWYGAVATEKPHYGKNSKKTPLTPVILTLISKEDLEMKNTGYSDKEFWDILEKFWNRDIFEKVNGQWKFKEPIWEQDWEPEELKEEIV